MVVNSELVQLLGVEERRAVLAHEAAHVLADHVLYFTALNILLRMGTSVRLPIVAGLPLMAVRYRAAGVVARRELRAIARRRS